ncbi:leucine rich repeat variant [Calothrix sp. NIES-4101]|nr:leucine rich repeat variant [Calothrix sp. NIES-4101]
MSPKNNPLLEEALDENTPTERLREIVRKGNKTIRNAVARNPNTPPDILIECFYEFPNHVLNNPALELILLENPNFLNELVSNNPFVFNDELPLFFVEWASRHPKESIRESVATSIQTPFHILAYLAADVDEDVRYKVAENHKTPSYSLAQLAVDNSYKIRIAVAENITTTSETLEKLAQDEDENVRSKVAANERTPLETLEMLARDKCGMVRMASVENPCLSSESLETIFNSLIALDMNIIQQIKLPLTFVDLAINHSNANIRLAVAANHYTPQNFLAKLVSDEVTEIRLTVAKNPNTSKSTLKILIHDTNDAIAFVAALQLRQKLEDYYFDDDEENSF